MSTASRDGVARVLVRVSSKQQPSVQHHCPRCATERRFASSGNFRVNAQRKTIDAWLIFLCTECDYRWNLPVHERQPVKAIDPIELEALMHNDPALADRLAFTAGGSASEIAVALTLAAPIDRDTAAIEIKVAVTAPCAIRLDRLLAIILGLPRAEIQTLARVDAVDRASLAKGAAPVRHRWPDDPPGSILLAQRPRLAVPPAPRRGSAQYPRPGSTGLSRGLPDNARR